MSEVVIPGALPPPSLEQALLAAEPRFPCEVCGKQKSRTWVALPGTANTTLGWVCHFCTDPRAGNLRVQLAAAEAKLARILDAWHGFTHDCDARGEQPNMGRLRTAIEEP
jgi:hypothetical protein